MCEGEGDHSEEITFPDSTEKEWAHKIAMSIHQIVGGVKEKAVAAVRRLLDPTKTWAMKEVLTDHACILQEEADGGRT